MFALGVVEFAFLNVLAGFAALSIALRGKFAGRAEIALATGILWNALIALPIYVLGLTNHLDAKTLAWSSGVFFAAVLALSTRDRAAGGRALASAAWSQARVPFDALRAAWHARSLVLVGLLASVALILWTGISAYFSPSWRQWDALWYHEPMVAFAIQNHGFSMVSLPLSGLQKINGYPRFCEMTQLWFVIFTDRRLIDIANSFLAPLFMIAVYLLARRPASERVTPMGWASAVLIMPASSILLQSAYVDLHTALLIVAAAYFSTRSSLRIRDVWLAALCLAMAIGAKILSLVPCGVLTLIVLFRLLRFYARERPRATLATVVGGSAMLLGMAASTYWRNWKHFHNPFWPDLAYDNPRWGIHWPGISSAADAVNMNQPFGTLIDNLTSIPYSRGLGHVTQVYEYGFVTGFLIVPLAMAAAVAVVLAAVRSLAGRIFRRPSWRMRDDTGGMVLLLIPLAVSLYLSPALWGARYNIPFIALAVAFISWAGGRPRFERLAEGAVATAIIGAIIAFCWTTPRWWYTPSELVKLARVPYPDREVTPSAMISPTLGLASASGIPFELGTIREKTLGAGATLAFDDIDGSFIALFWNNNYSNRVVYVPSGPGYLERVEQARAIWLYCNYGDPVYAELRKPDSGWIELGPLNIERWGVIFRRARW